MKKTTVPYSQIPQLSKTDVAYACGDPLLRPFFAYAPSMDQMEEALAARSRFATPRNDLADVLLRQYSRLQDQPVVNQNIAALRADDCFTIVTAHQPCLFLGPLYFIYKALTTIHLAHSLNAGNRQGKRIVPVLVLGSEDHDLEELNHANLFGKRILWEPSATGPVGSMPSASLEPSLQALKEILGDSESAQKLFERIQAAYAPGRDFAEATQALLHEFLGKFGLIVLNTNDPVLKRHFIPAMREELLKQTSFGIVNQTIAELGEQGFKSQAPPREINLFYMSPGMRERIVLENGTYKVLNTGLSFSSDEIIAELEAHPERFSPNVVLRPLYQETILPNLAYVGGGGELAYWLERKKLFEHFGVHFPMLVRRHSVMWLDKDAQKKLEKFGFSEAEFFGDTEALVKDFISKNAEGEVQLKQEIAALHAIYDGLAAKAAAIDPTLEKAVRADEVKASGALEQWESRLLRAEKQKHEVTINQIRGLKSKLFPNNGLQERTDNFLPYMLKYGDGFIDDVYTQIEDFDQGFVVISE